MHLERSPLFGLDPALTYLNHGAFGATPLAVLEEQTRWQRLLEQNPTTFFNELAFPGLDATRAAVGGLIGTSPESISLVPNTTTGVNTVLRSLPITAASEILITTHTYGACRYAAEFIADRTGASIVLAEIPIPVSDPAQVLEAIESAITPKTSIALIDHVTSTTALVFPIAEIVAMLRARNVLSIIDGAHAPGMIPLNLDTLAADFYIGNCHKWVCGPKGTAFLYAADGFRDDLAPLAISWGFPEPFEGRSVFHSRFDAIGTTDLSAHCAVPKAIEAMGATFDGGWPAVMDHNNTLVCEGRDLILEVVGAEAPAPDGMIGSIAVIPLEGTGEPVYSNALETYLRTEHSIIVPISPGPDPATRWLRVSAQIYNTIDDYEQLAEALIGYRNTRSP